MKGSQINKIYTVSVKVKEPFFQIFNNCISKKSFIALNLKRSI